MNPFEALGLPLRLDLDGEELDRVVREASQRSHPDAGGDEAAFQAVRQAGDVLKNPLTRLRAALETSGIDFVERGGVPGEVMDYFSAVAGILKRVDDFVNERGKALSGLGKAVLDVKIPGIKRELEGLVARLGDFESRMITRFGEFDQRGWNECFEEMSEVSRGLVFVRKWLGQLREANGKLFEALLGG